MEPTVIREDEGGQQVVTAVPQTRLATRKKLPWLDTTKDAPKLLEQHPEPQPKPKQEMSDPGRSKYIPSALLSDDLRYRPTGSTPEIREVTQPREIRSRSQTSQRLAGLNSPPSLARGLAIPSYALPSYASSEYSSAATLSDHDTLPKGFPKKDATSYERLVGPSPRSILELTQRTMPRNENQAAASARETTPKGTTRPKPIPSPYRPHALKTEPLALNGRRRASGTTPEIRRRSTALRELPAKQPILQSKTTTLDVRLQIPLESTSSSSQSPRSGATARKPVPRTRQTPRTLGRARPTSDRLMPISGHGIGKVEKSMLPLDLSESSDHGVHGASKFPAASHTTAANTASELCNDHGTVVPRRMISKDDGELSADSAEHSISRTPPRLYHPRSVDSIVRDFAYTRPEKRRRNSAESFRRTRYGDAAAYYGDHGESVATQPGIRHSVIAADVSLPVVPAEVLASPSSRPRKHERVYRAHRLHNIERAVHSVLETRLRRTQPTPTDGLRSATTLPTAAEQAQPLPDRRATEPGRTAQFPKQNSQVQQQGRKESATSDSDAIDLSLKNPRVNHISVKEGEDQYLRRYHKPQPVAREWKLRRKRFTSVIACLNTIFVGLIAGIYAGEVPRIQYQLEDDTHWVIFGNMLLFAGLGLSTLLFWPLPLLHGRRPYTLIAFGIMLPLQIPQAMIVQSPHGSAMLYKVGLLLPRALTGFALGFANINFLPTLWDL